MDKMIKFRVPAQMKDEILRYAREHDTTVSEIIRHYLQSLLDD